MPPERPRFWRVQVATAGLCRNGSTYPLDVLHRCCNAYDRSIVRFHPRRRGHSMELWDAALWIGLLRDPRPNAHGVEAVLEVFEHRQDIAEWLYETWRASLTTGIPPVGMSHVIDVGDFTRVHWLADGRTEVADIRRARVDLVALPAMNGTGLLGPLPESETVMFTQSIDPAACMAAIRSEIDELFEAEKSLEARRVDLARNVAPLHAAAGDAVLQAAMKGGSATPALSRSAEIRSELEGVESAIDIARKKRQDAIERYWRAQTDDFKRQASERSARAEAHDAKTQKLLAELAAHEGSPYLPAYTYHRSLLQRGVHVDDPAPLPMTGVLREEVGELERQAAAISNRRIADQGDTVRGDTVDELAAEVMTNPMEIAPTIQSVREWAASAATPVLDSSGNQRQFTIVPPTPETRYHYTLNWRAGKIDARQSSVKRNTNDPTPKRQVA